MSNVGVRNDDEWNERFGKRENRGEKEKELTTCHFPSRGDCLGRNIGTVNTYTSSKEVVRFRQKASRSVMFPFESNE